MIKSFLRIYRIGIHYPKTVLATALILTVISIFSARHLKIETSMTALAPKNALSVRNDEEYKRKFGGKNFLIVLVENIDPIKTERFADLLSTQVQQLPQIWYVDYKRPVEFFEKRRWLYLEIEDLREIQRRIEHTVNLEKKGISVAFGNLMDFTDEEDRPNLNFDDIFKKYEKKGWILNKIDTDEEGNLISLRIRVREEAANVDAARLLVDRIKHLGEEIKQQNPELDTTSIGITGTLETVIEESDQIKHEMAIVSASVGLILILIVFFYFRNFQSIFLVGIPLIAGVIWTGGLVYLILGHLNLMTSFAGGILAGLGSDYGIYLLTRYYLERSSGKDFETACRMAFEHTGTATYGSMITTVGAFLALVFSRFGVFFEFGLLGVLGVLLNYLAMVIVLPSLLVFFDRRQKRIKTFIAGESLVERHKAIFTGKPFLGIAVAAVLISIAFLSVPSESKIHFEEEMMINKHLPGNRLYDKLDKVKGQPLSPTILITQGWLPMEKTVTSLEKRIEGDQEHHLVYNRVIGLSSFIPDNQDDKKVILERMRKSSSQLRWVPKNKKNDLLTSLEDSLHAKPVTRENLPQEVKRVFESPYQKDVFAVYLLPAFSRLKAQDLRRYHEGILDLRADDGSQWTAVDGTFVYDDILSLIDKEAPKGMVLISLFLAAVMYVLSRDVKRTLVTLGNLMGALVLLSAFLWLFKIRLNVMNIAAIPVILGTGIDSFIHFAQRYDESHDMKIALREKIPAIAFSNLTTTVGFAGLLLVSNPGLRSVGWVAVLGLGLVTILSCLVYPRCLIVESFPWRRRKRS